jgi:CDP-glycerol glycerophosphotransferase
VPNPQPDVEVVILAAGMGTRLGRPHPKPLTRLPDGRSFLRQQVDNARDVLGADVRITVVVGFKADLLLEECPDVVFAYNEVFDQTNTAASLLKGMRATRGDVVWMNGDVVFEPEVLERVRASLAARRSCVCVRRGVVSDEEVTYTLAGDGTIAAIAKRLADGLGEAVGINAVTAEDVPAVVAGLQQCGEDDYFERGLELAVAAGTRLHPVDITDLFAIEVDFESDLDQVRRRGGQGT